FLPQALVMCRQLISLHPRRTRSAEIKASALRPAAVGPCDHGNALPYGISLSSGGLGGVWGFGNALAGMRAPLRALRLLALNERGVCFCYHKQIEYADARGDGELELPSVPGFGLSLLYR
ncbi:hypothetical protein M9458_035411, partial [Cirrhinus mrigala]